MCVLLSVGRRQQHCCRRLIERLHALVVFAAGRLDARGTGWRLVCVAAGLGAIFRLKTRRPFGWPFAIFQWIFLWSPFAVRFLVMAQPVIRRVFAVTVLSSCLPLFTLAAQADAGRFAVCLRVSLLYFDPEPLPRLGVELRNTEPFHQIE